jgi:pimeloyl-ACP methyl ester carboxylesterase
VTKRVLLVHGAFHGAWCWEPVISMLVDAGVEATALDLPGHGQDPGPLSDLHGDAARVRAELDRLGSDVVLVGHSYGGAVITEAGDHPAVDHLVYVAAMALDSEETCISAARADAAASGVSYDGRPSLTAGVTEGPDGAMTLEPSAAARCLYNTCDETTVAWALARLGPQPMATMVQTPSAVAWRSKPSTYVVCAEDLAVHPGVQRILARRCTTALEWPTDHSPFLCEPERVVHLLSDLASGAPGSG